MTGISIFTIHTKLDRHVSLFHTFEMVIHWTSVQSDCIRTVAYPANTHPVPLFTKRTDLLPQDLMKSRSRENRGYTFPIPLKFDRHFGSSAAEMPVKLPSDMIITDVLSQDLVKPWSHELGSQNLYIVAKFDSHIYSNAAEMVVKYRSNYKVLHPCLTTLWLCQVWCWEFNALYI